ncbi:c-type cytochrome [Xanthobacter autotrophicus]|uniref:c-type cytochrome n=1 Tax=Xanthobacter autotrophicus TaxID=280 RepID=UPI0024A6A034|nr:c-type cytochrome [Xanthobacter autotrophicus]MDI4655407.1 c-type cytochrome [Xanthobacter autotrophicus]
MRLILASVLVLAATGSALADPDVAKGEIAFKKCMACHAVGPDAKAKVGPPLNGIVGAKWAHFDGYAYSADIKDGGAAGKVWDEATLDAYVTNPKALAPKGKMAFAGIKNEDERKDLIAFLAQFNADGSKK